MKQAIKKIFKAFKSLPPEMRMFLAMAGLGSPIGIIYVLRRHLFPGMSMFMLILCVMATFAVLGLLIWIVSSIFGRRKKKRANAMASELSSDSGVGPQSMDASAQIKENNQKFFAAVKDMKKNAGLSVYELPWYIVVGDSGCGKTRLINEGGLMFSMGKPEGYQLGTLNYNWWFTEDAVFVDMAGRLCNPQDDSDRREWLAFLDTISKGRKGFPINGVIVCVSAEHLLEDGPEEHERLANIALERLRELQIKLGVTFATYLAVTKCDKMLGFLQFFELAGERYALKKQMFGWSRPGTFDEQYDPDTFANSFSALYARLNDLRLRRISDDSDETELGLAYAFPEEFRELYEPLYTYVRTLFPMRRKSKAMKNLIFRGVYFTSAEQKGEILKRKFREQLGDAAADYLQPLDLWPKKQPYFINDLMFRKVFPEHGLVFRNEEQVVRNRRLSRLLTWGTSVLAVSLVILFVWCSSELSRVMTDPRQDAKTIANATGNIRPASALKHAAIMGEDAKKLRSASWAMSLLTLSIGRDRPIKDIERIRLTMVEQTMVKALQDADEVLRRGPDSAGVGGDAYIEALAEYLTWLGCTDGDSLPSAVTRDGFVAVFKITPSESIAHQDGFDDQVDWYFQAVASGHQRNPAKLLAKAGLVPRETVTLALKHAYGVLQKRATLTSDHPDATVRAWMRIRESSDEVKSRYEEILALAERHDPIRTREDLQEFQTDFLDHFRAFDSALSGCAWPDEQDIASLADALLEQRKVWIAYRDRLLDLADACSEPDETLLNEIQWLVSYREIPSRFGLDKVLWTNMIDIELVSGKFSTDVYDDEFATKVSEVYIVYPQFLRYSPADEQTPKAALGLTTDAEDVRSKLSEIHDNLSGVSFDVPANLSDETVGGWADELHAHLGLVDDLRDGRADIELPDLKDEFWRIDQLRSFFRRNSQWIQMGKGTVLLLRIRDRLIDTGVGGISELVPFERRADVRQAAYLIAVPTRSDAAADARERSESRAGHAEARPSRQRRDRHRSRTGDEARRSRRSTPTASRSRDTSSVGTLTVPAYVTREFLVEQAKDWEDVLFFLSDMREGVYFLGQRVSQEVLSEECKLALEQSCKRYMKTYIERWSGAYHDRKLAGLEGLSNRRSTWRDLAGSLDQSAVRQGIRDDLGGALEWVLKCVPFAPRMADAKGNWYHWSSDEISERKAIGRWFDDALRDHWSDQSRYFVLNAVGPRDGQAGGEPPWVAIAVKFETQWDELSKRISQNEDLPERFTDNDRADFDGFGRNEPIPWGKVEALREAFRLTDEKLSGQVVEFETRAQELLSVELTRILKQIQRVHFRDAKPFDGWPYLHGEKYGSSGLKTVDFGAFYSFLIEVHRAKQTFDHLERDISDSVRGRAERRRFYESCEEWYTFLGLDAEEGTYGKPLSVAVKREDALSPPLGKEGKPRETAQYVLEATYMRVFLGTRLQGPNVLGTIDSATKGEARQWTLDAKWDWNPGGPTGELYVALVNDGGSTIGNHYKVLGRASPLALCAYVHRFGVTNDRGRNWYITHKFDDAMVHRRESGAPGEKMMVGEKLVFTMEEGRPMPEPIRKLESIRLD